MLYRQIRPPRAPREALVAMFKWYQRSAMMIVFLRGVRPSQHGALVRNIWNARAWTLQEYVAAKVILLHRGLDPVSRPAVPEPISEIMMEQSTGDGALGRLLDMFTVSLDVSILTWTGQSGSFLPSQMSVFNGPLMSHLPPTLSGCGCGKNHHHITHFFIRPRHRPELIRPLSKLPTPGFAASRTKPPCIAFQLPLIDHVHTVFIARIPLPLKRWSSEQDMTSLG